jgi:hypothetical protein
MTKGKSAETPAKKPRRTAFRPTQAQRAFVAAAAGLGVPRRVICQMLPGAKPGETTPISAHLLRDYFSRELREGMKLVVALVGARVCQRALSDDDRGALQAQMAVLNGRGGWTVAAEPLDEPPLDMRALSREERDQFRRLLAKATDGQQSDDDLVAADAARRPRGRWQDR